VTNKALNIVCLQIPYPVNNGASIEMFSKIKALHAQGIPIYLHCFYKNNQLFAPELLQYCKEVHYYKRQFALPIFTPYIVGSRQNKILIQRLLQNNYPILIEGVHCSGLAFNKQLNNGSRKIIVRLHNVEHLYYRGLIHSTQNVLKKIYYTVESIFLKNYEKKLAQTAQLCAITNNDAQYFVQNYKAKNITVLHPFFEPLQKSTAAKSQFFLYHGNLAVPENQKAVTQLIQTVFKHTQKTLVIAGQNPSQQLHALANTCNNVTIVANPNPVQMLHLQNTACAHILPAVNHTGVKFKLLQAISLEAACITNSNGAAGLANNNLVIVANTPQQVLQLLNQPNLPSMANNWQQYYNTTTQTQQLITLLF
jgi:glycosyltransferase involved in cell wall biosynthesis